MTDRYQTVVIDNASVLNASQLLAGCRPPTAVGVHDLGTVVHALLVADRLEVLVGHSYAALTRLSRDEPWDLSNPHNLYETLRARGVLSGHVLDASWHNDQLERRAEIDAFAASVDFSAALEAARRLDVDDWVALVFGDGMPANDSNPIYAAPPDGWSGEAVELADRRVSHAELFVSQTLLYVWHAGEQGHPLMTSALRAPIVEAAHASLARTTRSALASALEALDDAERRLAAELLDVFPIAFPEFSLPSTLAHVIAQASSVEDVLPIALELRDDRRFTRFRAWVAEVQAALADADVRRLRTLGGAARRVRTTPPSPGDAVVGLATRPTATLARMASHGIDAVLSRLALRTTLIADVESGRLRKGGSLSRLEQLLGARLEPAEVDRLASLRAPP